MNIPKARLGILAKMCQLDKAATKQILGALRSTAIDADPDVMAEKISGSVPSIPVPDLKSIVETVCELNYVRDRSQQSIPAFVDELVEGIIDTGEFTPGKDGRENVRGFFDQLLRIEALSTFAKADGLQQENERLFCCVRILSDIRPLFGDDIDAGPTGGVVTHLLRIGFLKDNSHEEIYMALDANDLQKLGEAVERAKQKDRALVDFFKKIGVPRVGN